MLTNTNGRVRLSTSQVAPFQEADTAGNEPAMVVEVADQFETAKYEIGAMVKSRMTRLLVVCDMHGADLREVIGPKLDKINVHDGRSVMREAILAELNRLNRDIQKVLDSCP